MSIEKVNHEVYKVRWREGGRNRSLHVHGPHELAKKILRKKLSARDPRRPPENRPYVATSKPANGPDPGQDLLYLGDGDSANNFR